MSDCDAYTGDAIHSPADDYDAEKHGALLASLPPLTRISLIGIHEAIDRLQRIATSVRRVSSSTVTSRVGNFANKFAKDDFDAIAVLLVLRQCPDMPETLAKQLGSSIAFRRLRLLYQRRHQQKLQQHRDFRVVEEQNHEALTVTVDVPQEAVQTEGPVISPPVQRQIVTAFDNLSVTDHSTLRPVEIPDDVSDQQSVISGSTDMSSIAGQSHLYPKPPKPSEDSAYCRCEWCFEELRAERLQRKGWWR